MLHYNLGRNPIFFLRWGVESMIPRPHICLSFMYSLHFGTPGTFFKCIHWGYAPTLIYFQFHVCFAFQNAELFNPRQIRSLAVEQGKSLQLKICGIAPGCCRFCLDVLHVGNMSNYQQKLLGTLIFFLPRSKKIHGSSM